MILLVFRLAWLVDLGRERHSRRQEQKEADRRAFVERTAQKSVDVEMYRRQERYARSPTVATRVLGVMSRDVVVDLDEG